MRRWLVGVLLLGTLATVARAEEPVNVPWPDFLPALASPNGTPGGPQPRCRKATMKCIDIVIRRLRARQDHFGCDHRAVFATTYLTLTRVMRRTMRADRHFFRDRSALLYEDALFAHIYFQTLKRYRLGQPVDAAWQIALDNATSGDLQGAGDMLLGINAHVQNDMPFLLAQITLRDSQGRSRRADHNAENAILDDAFDEVVALIGRRYDPLTTLETTDLSPVTDVFAMELVKTWREGVWRNAERLVNAKTDAEREFVADGIHQQAASTAMLIEAATQGPPGYRATRDAYCAEQVAASTR
ncbi:MAG: hypothetical protein QOF76_2202 [Solirubrobacteraceae bacterium]|nr:hypothetical protein [Solirubrobacteraceae bacterium]